jgi:hypothetical protein
MRHPSKVGAFCSRKGDTHPTSGPPRSGMHLKRGPRPRQRRAVEIPGRRATLNMAEAILLGAFARMLGHKRERSEATAAEAQS